MRVRRLFIASVLGLGLTVALVLALSLIRGALPGVHAASFTVDTTTDENDGSCADGDCSLRDAIVVANGNSEDDTITLGSGTYVLSLAGADEDAAATGDLDITAAEALTITGLGPNQTIIDANGLDRVFELRPGAGTVVISGVTIMGGNVTGDGGGVYNHDADLTLINTIVVSNTASRHGGGVFVDYDSRVTLNDGQIVSNTAGSNGGGVGILGSTAAFTQTGASTIAYNAANGYGGGVYMDMGRATLSDGQVFSNTVGSLDYGGGVYVHRGHVTLNGAQVISNAASFGGGVYLYQGSATLSGGEIVYNDAGSGGGVYVATNMATFTQTGGLVAHNTANNAGGGIYLSEGSATLSGGEILDNNARYGGGVDVVNASAFFTQTGGVVISNTAAIRGGGVYVVLGGATLSGGAVISNTANGDGGGMYNYGGTLTLINTTVSGNAADDWGGGLYSRAGASSVLTYTTVVSNAAGSAGGGIYAASAITVQNSIVAHNDGGNCNTALTSNGHNLEDTDICGFNASGDLPNTDPLLEPLTEESGTWLYPLPENSPAVDAGACVAGITTDQRGVTRPQGNGCDIGAYEWQLHYIYLPLALNNYQ